MHKKGLQGIAETGLNSAPTHNVNQGPETHTAPIPMPAGQFIRSPQVIQVIIIILANNTMLTAL